MCILIMGDNQIFGSNVVLPSLPGLQSDCEEEILLLMKEVDFEFQRKHSELLTELVNVRSLCHAQKNEIENLRCLLQNNDETAQRDNLEEVTKKFSSDIEKLKKENEELRSENSSLKRRVQRFSGYELQLDSLKRSLCIQQDENKMLRERLSKVEEQYQSLQVTYQRVVKTLTSLSQNNESQNQRKTDVLSPPNLMQSDIVQTTEKFMSEETEFCNDFLSNINQEIDNLERKLRREVS